MGLAIGKAKVLMVLQLALMACSGAALADEVAGRVRGAAQEAGIISLDTEKGVLLIRYDKGTLFRNVKKAADLKADDGVTVAYGSKGEDHLASSVTRVVPRVPEGVKSVTAAELEELLQRTGEGGRVQVIDTRPQARYEAGHIAGAVSVPLEGLEKKGSMLLPIDRQTTLVFYGDGPSSELGVRGAALAVQFGFKDVRVYPEGEAGWEKGEGMVAIGYPQLKKGGWVVIDLRPPAAVREGHIPGAVGFPADTLAREEKRFPGDRRVPLVFYGDREEELRQAVKTVRKWGFRQVRVFRGGVRLWQERGNELANGPAGQAINFAGRMEIGELKPMDFELSLKSTVSVVILDVRTAAEFARGHLPQAVSIPLEELAGRFEELPRNRIMVIHCSDGRRAEMAFDFLRQRGYRAVFLKAPISFRKNGEFTIAE